MTIEELVIKINWLEQRVQNLEALVNVLNERVNEIENGAD